MNRAFRCAACAALLWTVGCERDGDDSRPERRSDLGQFKATAYSIEGTTRRGTQTREGIVAADRSILPLGSFIEISGAGPYSGKYVVTDTGAKVAGREIDIYLANDAEAKRFGVQQVAVRVLRWGDDEVLDTTRE